MINHLRLAHLIIAGFLILIASCGSNHDKPSGNLIGTYNLSDFRVEFSNGTTFTPDNLNVFGMMVIDASSITQNLTIEGTNLSSSGEYTVTFISAVNSLGILTITGSSGTTYEVSFTISGPELRTYSGIKEVDSSLTVEEWDTWRKISDVPQAPSLTDRSESEDGYWWIFKSLVP